MHYERTTKVSKPKPRLKHLQKINPSNASALSPQHPYTEEDVTVSLLATSTSENPEIAFVVVLHNVGKGSSLR